jgi:hypothetical protein
MRYLIVLKYILIMSLIEFSSAASGGISVEPFVSISSTKKIQPNKTGQKNVSGGSSTETEIIKQRTTYGIRGSLGFFRILKLQASVGTNELTTTSKTSQAVDDYEQIDYQKDLNMDTSNPDKEVRIKETQRKGSAVLVVDPGFWIFILRAKAGVIATQRLLSKEASGEATTNYVSPISYKPTCGAGAGIRFSSNMFFMAEYNIFLYKFPKKSPFEREVTVSYGFSI